MVKPKYRVWIAGWCIAMSAMFSGCTIDLSASSGDGGRNVAEITSAQRVSQKSSDYSLRFTDDQAQVKAFFGDLLFSDRYDGAVPEDVRARYADADIGAPLVIARDNEGNGKIYLPLSKGGEAYAVGSLSIQRGRMSFYDIQAFGKTPERLFDISRETLDQKLEPFGRHVKSYSFVIEPTLYGQDHDEHKPLCQIETVEGDRADYLFERDAFIDVPDMVKLCKTTSEKASAK